MKKLIIILSLAGLYSCRPDIKATQTTPGTKYYRIVSKDGTNNRTKIIQLQQH